MPAKQDTVQLTAGGVRTRVSKPKISLHGTCAAPGSDIGEVKSNA